RIRPDKPALGIRQEQAGGRTDNGRAQSPPLHHPHLMALPHRGRELSESDAGPIAARRSPRGVRSIRFAYLRAAPGGSDYETNRDRRLRNLSHRGERRREQVCSDAETLSASRNRNGRASGADLRIPSPCAPPAIFGYDHGSGAEDFIAAVGRRPGRVREDESII